MTFYKELEKALYNKGKKSFVLVQRGDEMYCIFSPVKDNWGNYRDSSWRKTEEEAKKYFGYCPGYSEEEINSLSEKENWKIIKTYSLKDLI